MVPRPPKFGHPLIETEGQTHLIAHPRPRLKSLMEARCSMQKQGQTSSWRRHDGRHAAVEPKLIHQNYGIAWSMLVTHRGSLSGHSLSLYCTVTLAYMWLYSVAATMHAGKSPYLQKTPDVFALPQLHPGVPGLTTVSAYDICALHASKGALHSRGGVKLVGVSNVLQTTNRGCLLAMAVKLLLACAFLSHMHSTQHCLLALCIHVGSSGLRLPGGPPSLSRHIYRTLYTCHIRIVCMFYILNDS